MPQDQNRGGQPEAAAQVSFFEAGYYLRVTLPPFLSPACGPSGFQVPEMSRKPSQTPGERLKEAILADFELNAGELALLDRAAALTDELQRIEAEMATRPLVTAGSRGQEVADPLLREHRQHSEVLQRVLEAIGLPVAGEDEGESGITQRARRAAQIRWARERSA